METEDRSIKGSTIRLLRWSERYTKTDMVYLISGGFWLSVAQFAAALAAFFITVLLANTVSPETLGEYRFLLAGFTLLSIIALPGMRSALRESTPKGWYGNLRVAFSAMMRWGLLGSIAALGAAAYYYTKENTGLAMGFVVIALALPFFDASAAYLEYLNALKHFKKTTLYTITTRAVLFVITVGVIFTYPEYAWIILAAFFLGHIIPNLFFHYKTVRTIAETNPKADPGLTTYAKHLTAMAALGLIAGQLDKFFVWEFIGAGGLAIFYIAYTLPQESGRFLGLVSMLAFPKFATTPPQTIRHTLMSKLLKYLCVIVIIICVYIYLAPYIFTLLFPQYMDAILYSQVLMLVTLSFAFSPIRTYLTTIKATGPLYTLSVIPPSVRIIVALCLIIPLGLWGAVCALLAEALMRTILLIFFFYTSRERAD